MSKKIGIIARVDNSGLANQTFDYWKHIHEITKALVIVSSSSQQDLLRYPEQVICDGFPTLEQIDLFLKDIDLVIAIETPYNWNVFSMAKERGIKTILIPNYEWTEENPPIHPDLYLCPSLLERDIYKYYPTKSEYLQFPIDRKIFPFKLRTKAKVFVFNNGRGGTKGRNGLVALLQAIPLVKSDVKFIIRSQVSIPEIKDERVDIRLGETKREDLFKEGDVLLLPRMFGALSLPTWEAISSGMPVLSTDLYPFNEILPKNWFFKADRIKKGQTASVSRVIDIAIVKPEVIAQKIDEWAGKDITEESKKADKIAEKISWENMKDKYEKVFKTLLNQSICHTQLTEKCFYMPIDDISGWMTREQLIWLGNTAKEMDSIVEIGSYKGKGTYALLSGCKGTVWAVDPFGNFNEEADFYQDFLENVGHFKNLKPLRMTSEEAVKQFKDKSVDMVFIDGSHKTEDVKKDIEMWLPKTKKVICGHDYQGVDIRQAIDEMFEKVEVLGNIWIYRI